MSSRPRLFLIDGYSNIFRAFYAIRNLSNSRGEPTNAVYGFVNMLRKLLREERPDHVGVALDVSRRTVRTAKFEDYKANRKPMPEDLRPQVPKIREVLEAYRIPVLEMEDYEADDVLGTLACKAADDGYDVVLVSADKDLMQLVGPHVRLYHTGREKLYDAKGVEEDFGLPPEKVVDVLALMGDSVDNVPGVPGIGEKGAKGLIAEYGSLEELLARAGEVSRKSYREGLQEHAGQARLSRELVTIHCDLPVAFEPDRLVLEPADNDALRRLFTELEFFSLVDELTAAGAGPDVEAAAEATDPAAWRRATAGLGKRLAVAVLGEEEPIGLVVGGAGTAAAEGGGGPAGPVTYADFRRPGMRDAAMATLAAWASDDGVELVGHDVKEVLRCAHAGMDRGACCATLVDLMLVSYLLKPSIHGHSLDELALERLRRKPLSAKDAGWDGKGQVPETGGAALADYAGERVELVRRLAGDMAADLAAQPSLERIYREIEAPLVPVLLEMEETGILLDRPYLAEMSKRLAADLETIDGEITDVAGERFNINSPQQLGVILFEKLGYPVIKKTRKTKHPGTGADVLEELAQRGYPLPELILRYRELSKLKSTYVDALPELVAADGRLHTRFNQAVAATGRLSSTSPNLQNIPVRTELGQSIRKAFVAAPGHLLLVADYSQVELRILAHIAGEEALIEAFRSGEDIHRTTAAAVLGVAPELVNAEQRRAAKTINFGIIYGMSAFGLANTLHVSRKEAESFITAYFERYPGVKRYMDETLAAAEETGGVETLYGRVRWLPDIQSKNWNLRENARRMAINARIQGTAADLMKEAMIAVDRRLRRDHPDGRLLLTVHDELVLEVPEAGAEAAGEMVQAEMAGVADLAVPLVVDVGTGRSWYDAKD
jgi:DNA polymerase-1